MGFQYNIFPFLLRVIAKGLALGIPLLMLCALSVGLDAQSTDAVATATFRPISITGTASVFGSGSKVGIWEINICSNSPMPAVIPRQRIMQAAPAILEMPNKLAQDLMARQAYSDKRTVLARWLPISMTIGGAYFTAYGISQNNKLKTIAGYSGGVIGLLSQVVAKQVPDPSPYLMDLMPDSISLAALQCATGYVASSLMKNPMAIGPVDIHLPK